VKIGDPAAVPALMQALDKNISTFTIVEALGKLQNPIAVPRLVKVLKYANSGFIRSEAANSLGLIRSSAAVPYLVDALSDIEGRFDRSSAKKVCDIAAEALISIGTKEALAAVEKWKREQEDKQT
jgi:HEAT repeat protein